ncbi:LLM class flavin-dependent oxidoreductase [Thermopolyspora sp. NPDC052614]|uniref:LLM class flavin-dependent oxidoreductase n=1 Tax=Thermopolyspora sp. NPDC052614 TaxID=3155682 RepID=UPI00343BFE04
MTTTTTFDEPVGLLYQMWEVREEATADLVRRAFDEFAYAEELGYDSVWVGEHHNVQDAPFYGRIPVPELLLARVAATTSRLRLGTGVKVLPSVPAQRSAEEMCLLDLVSGGRAEFGVGQGTAGPADPEARRRKQERFRELFGEILMLLRGDTSTGLPLLNVGPAPHLISRIWAACRDDASIDYVAERGVNFVVGQAEIAEAQARYVARYRAAGGTGKVRGVRAVFIGESREEAMARFGEAFETYYAQMGRNGRYAADATAAGLLPAQAVTLDGRLRRACVIVGDPDQVTAQLREYLEVTGVDQLDLLVQFPGLAPEPTRRTLELFQRHVRPALAGAARHG